MELHEPSSSAGHGASRTASDGPALCCVKHEVDVRLGMLRCHNTYVTYFALHLDPNLHPRVDAFTSVDMCVTLATEEECTEYKSMLEEIKETELDEDADETLEDDSEEAKNSTVFRVVYTPNITGRVSMRLDIPLDRREEETNETVEDVGLVRLQLKANVLGRSMGKPMLRSGVIEIAKGNPALETDIETEFES